MNSTVPVFLRMIVFVGVCLVSCLSLPIHSNAQLLTKPNKPLAENVTQSSQRLLRADWDRDPKKETQSTTTFGAAKSDHPVLLLAYTLNRLQHNQARQAKVVAGELTTKHPEVLDGWMLKAWINALTNDYDVACIDMRRLKAQLKKTRPNKSVEKSIYQRFGRIIGYFQGPVVKNVNKELLESTIVFLADGLPPDQLKAFNDSRNQTLSLYDDILKAQGDKTQVELAKVKAVNDRQAINLEQENQQLTNVENQLRPEKERIRETASQEISRLQQEGQSVELQLTQISSDIRLTQLTLQNLYVDLNAIQNAPPAYRGSLYLVSQQIRNAELGLINLQNSGLTLNNQLANISNQIARTRNSADSQIRDIDRQIKKAWAAKKRNQNKLAKIAAGPKIAHGKKDAMLNKVKSLRTFDDLSLELYRQELLESLQ